MAGDVKTTVLPNSAAKIISARIAELHRYCGQNPAQVDDIRPDIRIGELQATLRRIRESEATEQPEDAPCIIDPENPDDFPDRKDCLRAGEHVCGAQVPKQAYRRTPKENVDAEFSRYFGDEETYKGTTPRDLNVEMFEHGWRCAEDAHGAE